MSDNTIGGPAGSMPTSLAFSQAGWSPAVTLDIMAATPRQFEEKRREFYRLMQDVALPQNLLSNGVHTITPEIAEKLLLGKANRPLSVRTIAYYARQMIEGEWILTGEPVIISDDGIMRDAYHRCWACYLSGVPFTTWVVNVARHEYLFACIDNGRSRSVPDVIKLAGANGLSTQIAAAIEVAMKYESGVYNPHSRVRLTKMTPKEHLGYLAAHPTLRDAIDEVVSEYKRVLNELFPRKKAVLYFSGWQIFDLYGSDVLESFLTDLGDDGIAGGPIGLLRSKLLADAECRVSYSAKETLAFVIKAFNAWKAGRSMRRLSLATDEAFPAFDPPTNGTGGDDDDDEALSQPRTGPETQPQA